MRISNTVLMSISQMNASGIDADLNMGNVYKIKVNHIDEATALHTVVFDASTSLIDGLIGAAMGGSV